MRWLFPFIIILFFSVTSTTFAKEYPYKIEIPTKNVRDVNIVELRDFVANSTIKVNTEVGTSYTKNLKFYVAKRKISPENVLQLEVLIKNQDKRNQEDLELRIFVLDPLGVTRGDYTINLFQLINNRVLVAGDLIKLPYVYYEVPTGADTGEWKIYSIVYKITDKEKRPIAMSPEPQASFQVDYGWWSKWLPIVLAIVGFGGGLIAMIKIEDPTTRNVVGLIVPGAGIILFIIS